MILDQLERAFMVIGDKIIMAGSGAKDFDDFEILDENVTSELVVKPRPEEPKTHFETRQSLNNVTKKTICDLALERYGVELNFKTEKKMLISQYLALQEHEG